MSNADLITMKKPSRLVIPLIVLTLGFSGNTGYSVDSAGGGASTNAVVPASADEAQSKFFEARSLLTGMNGEKDAARAIILMRESADLGFPDAIGGMGYFYAMGVEVPKDLSAAVDWFRKGAEKGSRKSKLNLALAIANGRGVERDEKTGLMLLDEAAAAGLPEAMSAQGETYYYGQFGRSVDMPTAFGCFLSAAKAGNADAQNTLGIMYREGLGTEKNGEEAFKWLEMAAKRGHLKAQSNLAHTLGLETPSGERRIQALKWAMIAADRNEVMATKTLEELLPNLPPEEVAEARCQADQYTPAP